MKLGGRLEPEIAYAMNKVRSGSIFVDVGAHLGTYSYSLSKMARVEAFEPSPECCARLRAWSRASVHEIALSDSAGTANLYTPIKGGRLALGLATVANKIPHSRVDVVRTATLDSFDLHDVSLIKVDVEGHEAAVLRGARQTIGRELPALIVEMEIRHGADVPSLIATIQNLGYYLLPQLSPQNFLFEPVRTYQS
jgi:FkbM family methyltransferase